MSGPARWSASVPARLFAVAWLVGLLVSSGHFGSVDAERRFQVARSWWTEAPEVRAGDTGFGVVGRDGTRRAWYGAGQSLVFLVPDIIISTAVRAIGPLDRRNRALGDALVTAAVVLVVAPLVSALAVLHAFLLLQVLGFARLRALAGALSLLLATSFLHYAQVLQENNLILLLTLAGFYWSLRWVGSGARGHLLAGVVCLGANLLVRLTTMLDLVACSLYVGTIVWRTTDDRRVVVARLRDLIVVSGVVVAFLLLDRLYHLYRFGEWTSTYIGLFGDAMRAADPTLPPSFPFSTPFLKGFAGAFLSLRKSVFLFDPLAALCLVCLIAGWRQWAYPVRAFAGTTVILALAYVVFYARYFTWGGDAAWGDRFVVSAMQMLAMIAVPLMMSRRWPGPAMLTMSGVLIVGVLIQLSSVVFTFNLEIAQLARGDGSEFVVGRRLLNVWTLVSGGSASGDPALAPMFRPAFAPFTFAPYLGTRVASVVLGGWCVLVMVAAASAVSLVRAVAAAEQHTWSR
jgi:hypothetical protein